MAGVLLYAPQDFHNVCLLARTLDVFGQRDCHVYDPHGLFRERYGKVRSRELRVVSAGAFEKIHWVRVEEPAVFLGQYRGRVVATVADRAAPSLAQFRFSAEDLVLFGSESRGLPPEVVAACPAKFTIPARGETESLNLAVSLGIVLFERQRQLDATRAPGTAG